jgi:8-oxo-dGTP pyrophosphatase MutT (NUDIX family)
MRDRDEATLSVTQRIEREEFSRGHIGPEDQPPVPRPAATIIVTRPVSDGFEVLLLRRPDTSRFAAGAYVFPGGVIDAGDDAPQVLHRLPPGPADRDGPALAAALRELFEETGFLLADDPPKWSVLRPAREAVLRADLSFADLVIEHDLRFDRLDVAYISRWITPERFARRYDTRFFLAATAVGEPHLTDEMVGFQWLTPGAAVERFRTGTLPMLFPTRVTLESLAGQRDLSSLIASFTDAQIEPVMPRLLVRGDSVRPVLPGDPLFQEAGR